MIIIIILIVRTTTTTTYAHTAAAERGQTLSLRVAHAQRPIVLLAGAVPLRRFAVVPCPRSAGDDKKFWTSTRRYHSSRVATAISPDSVSKPNLGCNTRARWSLTAIDADSSSQFIIERYAIPVGPTDSRLVPPNVRLKPTRRTIIITHMRLPEKKLLARESASWPWTVAVGRSATAHTSNGNRARGNDGALTMVAVAATAEPL